MMGGTMKDILKGHWRALRVTLLYTIPLSAGYFSVGIAFGILMRAAGLGALWTLVMSLAIYAGSMQFLSVSLLTAAFAPVQAFLLSVLVNARHVFYGLSVLEKYRGMGRSKPFLIFGLTDEVFSLVTSVETPEGLENREFYFWLTAIAYGYWVTASVIGAFLGGMLPFDTTGLDFALTALFVVLFIEQWKKRENRPAGVIGVLCAVISLALAGPNNMVLCAMGLILAALLGGRKQLCK